MNPLMVGWPVWSRARARACLTRLWLVLVIRLQMTATTGLWKATWSSRLSGVRVAVVPAQPRTSSCGACPFRELRDSATASAPAPVPVPVPPAVGALPSVLRRHAVKVRGFASSIKHVQGGARRVVCV